MKNRIELHAKTKYSMDHESTVDIKDLILKCSSNGEKGVAIVDSGTILSFYKAEKILKELNLKDFKLIYGVEVNVDLNNNKYKAVILLKRRKGLSVLYRLLSPYFTTNELLLNELMQNREDFLIGLIYDENNYNPLVLQFFNYIEVDNKVSKEVISTLKKDNLVVYSNRINALSKDEELCKKIIYKKLHIKGNIDNRIYKTTQDILKEIDDKEIVIENSNKIFNMIDKFDLLEDRNYLPVNKNFFLNSLVNTKIHERYGNNIPLIIKKRVDLELKLIKKFNYEGYINLYKKIIDKCKEEKEEYVIYGYINNLYIAYLLGITHFDPVNLNLYAFFNNHPSITIKVSETFIEKLNMFIKKELNINTIRCKGIMTLNNTNIQDIISNYEKSNNIKISSEEILAINKYLMDYPLNNNKITSKELIIPYGINIFEVSPRELIEIMKDKTSYQRFTNIDYNDIEDKFITLQLISNNKITSLTELKNITGDRIINYDDN